jgi:hypothetical protein
MTQGVSKMIKISHVKLAKVGKVGYHKAHEAAHATYLALVCKEAHGYYGKAAGVLLIVVLFGWIIEFFGGHHEEVD